MSIMKMYVEEYLAAEQVAENRYIIHLSNGKEIEVTEHPVHNGNMWDSYSIFNYLARQYGVKIPIKTQGWINSSLLDITVKDGKMSGGHMSGKNQSTVIYKYMNQLIEAVRKDA